MCLSCRVGVWGVRKLGARGRLPTAAFRYAPRRCAFRDGRIAHSITTLAASRHPNPPPMPPHSVQVTPRDPPPPPGPQMSPRPLVSSTTTWVLLLVLVLLSLSFVSATPTEASAPLAHEDDRELPTWPASMPWWWPHPEGTSAPTVVRTSVHLLPPPPHILMRLIHLYNAGADPCAVLKSYGRAFARSVRRAFPRTVPGRHPPTHPLGPNPPRRDASHSSPHPALRRDAFRGGRGGGRARDTCRGGGEQRRRRGW